MFGLTFHPYGFLIGVALLVGWEIVQRACSKYRINFKQIQRFYVLIIIIGFIFARLWHGLTDWSLYAEKPLELLHVWNGGLSIIGGIIGGCIGAIVLLILQQKVSLLGKQKVSFLLLTDLLVHALPASQAIGRIGSFINQELYGLPTKLPWGIYIEPAQRLQSVATQTHFHPLFLYEILLNLFILVIIWRKKWTIGAGQATAYYLILYSLGRLLLDFLRIDRGDWVWMSLSLNQYVLLALAVCGLIICLKRHYQVRSAKTGK